MLSCAVLQLLSIVLLYAPGAVAPLGTLSRATSGIGRTGKLLQTQNRRPVEKLLEIKRRGPERIKLLADNQLKELLEAMIDSALADPNGRGQPILNDKFPRFFNTSLNVHKTEKSGNVQHSRLYQTLGGIRVWGADVIDIKISGGPVTLYDDKIDKNRTVTIQVDALRYQTGFLFSDLRDILSSHLSEEALRSVSNRRNAFNVVAKRFDTFRQRGRVVEPIMYVDRTDGENKLIPSYYVHMMVDNKNDFREVHSIVDTDGNVIREWNALATAKEDTIEGIGGNVKIGEQKHDIKVQKRDNDCKLDSNKVKTFNLHNGYDNLNETYALSCDKKKVETNGAYGVPYDIQWAGEQIVNMYDEWYGTKPVPTLPLIMKVHMGENYENAFYDNRKLSENGALFFGDGSSDLHPPVTADIVSHETGHAVVDHSSRLIYDGESGALNEAFADMAAMAAKYYIGGGSVSSWQIGDGVVKFDGGRFRCLDDPTCDGKSIGNLAQFTTDLEVHQASGVFNKAFYLISSKLKRGIWDAFDVFYTANAKFWTSTTSFTEAAEGALNALDSLKAGQIVWSTKYSYSWIDSDDFVNAFKQVGISCKKSDTWSCN